MNKTQKIIIIMALIILIFAIMHPPYLVLRSSGIRDYIIGSGWDWIFNLKAEKIKSGGYTSFQYQKIRLDVLLCEILAIGILVGFFVVLAKKIKKGGGNE